MSYLSGKLFNRQYTDGTPLILAKVFALLTIWPRMKAGFSMPLKQMILTPAKVFFSTITDLEKSVHAVPIKARHSVPGFWKKALHALDSYDCFTNPGIIDRMNLRLKKYET